MSDWFVDNWNELWNDYPQAQAKTRIPPSMNNGGGGDAMGGVMSPLCKYNVYVIN